MSLKTRCETCGTGFTGPAAYEAHRCPGILTGVPTNWITDLTAEREQLVAERDAYRDALAKVPHPTISTGKRDGSNNCAICHAGGRIGKPLTHKESCEWAKARTHALTKDQQ